MYRAHRPRGLGAVMLSVLIAAMIAVPGLRPVSADQLSDKQSQRDSVSKQMDNLKAQIAATKDQEAKLRLTIQSIDLQIQQTEQNVSDAQAKLDQIGRDLDDARKQLADTRARLAVDKQELSKQLIYIYKQGQTSMLNKVVGSKTFNQFWQQLIDLRRLAGTQQDTLSAVQREELRVDQLVAGIALKQSQQKQALADLKAQADGLQIQLGARQAAVAQLQAVEAYDAQQLALAEQSAKELDAQIAAIKEAMAEAARRGGGNGHFVWPENGPITQGFGCSPYQFEPYDPSCPSRHFHTGIDIGAAWGTPVGAGDAGIAYTYYSGYGYGNHVIIAHGNGWVSVYGHLASFAVGNGQAVGRGQTIGYEGSTGNSTGPHLHFEVRLNDNPVNPLQYLS
ncbi:MAG TPA: peptidoglycan DD-metalloendopeptidase family protein [Candidatus Angelobacter sp.]|jgi:murein DD-endopeptidase MepM/ murein hydrolase activator NlpD|nr:peptidoglycan DD-metalloendopeptidase family protein [Candidatus Angelobacter sp.]